MTKTKIIITTILSFVLVALIAASLTFNVLLGKELKTQAPVQDNVSNELEHDSVIIEPLQPKAMAMAAAATADENSYALTVRPDVTLSDTKIDWAIAFKNAKSAWATDKEVTDYATITPSSDGAMTATLDVKQAFGEQIIVTASVRGDSEVKTSCTVDYTKRKTVKYGFINLNTGDTNAKLEITVNYSQGTVDDTSASAKYGTSYIDNGFIERILKSIYSDRDLLEFWRQYAPTIYNLTDYFQEVIEASMEIYREIYPANYVSESYLLNHSMELPFFNYMFSNDKWFSGGFYVKNSKYTEDCELMMCRFLGLCATGPSIRETLTMPFTEYKKQLKQCFTDDEIHAFKAGINNLINKWGQEGTIKSTSDPEVGNILDGNPITDTSIFKWVYIEQPIYNCIVNGKTHPVFWCFNQFQV